MNRILVPLLMLAAGVLQADGSGAPASQGPPSWHELANATYSGIENDPVTLVDGQWRGAPYVEGGSSAPTVGLVKNFRLTGDLDCDGSEKAVALLWSSTGGSGTYDYVAVIDRNSAGTPVNVATARLGDRVRVMSAKILERRVVFDVVQADITDAACCPGQKLRRTFVLRSGELKETSSENLGRLSLEDLGGDWQLTHFSGDETVPDGIEITLMFDGSRISGKAACNRYNGAVSEGEMPGQISVDGPMAMTRMMCPQPEMDAERKWMQALEKITQFTFRAGELVLVWSDEGEMGQLVFSRKP